MKRIFYLGLLACALFSSCKKEDENGTSGGGGYVPPKEWTVSGTVKGNDNQPLAGVVVSDGISCVQTDANGNYQLPADLSKKDKDGNDRYVFVSTPSGYAAPTAEGHAIFWEWLKNHKSKKGSDGKYRGVDFTLTKIANPDRFTLLIFGDPQPRKYEDWSKWPYADASAFHSLDICKDMYDDMKEYAATLTGRPVYGIGLGDIVHQNTNLLTNYRAGMATTGITTYNVIGNHDQGHAKGMTDETACQAYESKMGPANYSFNLGGLHFLMLDNMLTEPDAYSDDCPTGLTDEIWQFVQNDLAFVSRDTPIMVCAHSPMCRMISGKDRTGNHLVEMRALLSRYSRVYAWAGHTHSTYNYAEQNNPIESHTVSRVTGALWTNEYLGENGTPRGYVVFEYDKNKGAGKEISWKFKPIYRQTAPYVGSYTDYGYSYRDWDYDANGKAVLKANRGGTALTDNYQMQVFSPGTYAANDRTVYVNVFLWDGMWQKPKFYLDGKSTYTTMTPVTAQDACYTYSDWNITAYYASKYQDLYNNWYKEGVTAKKNNCVTMFKCSPNGIDDYNGGTVKVTDRFGVEYSAHISW